MTTTTKHDNPNKLFPMFVTAKLDETRAFYVDKLGWIATFDMPGYLQVRSGAPEGPEISFMNPDSGAASGSPSFEGRGVVVSIPVPDADEHHATLRDRGVAPRTEPTIKPWGWRSYQVADPSGVILDFFHVAAPADQSAAPPKPAQA